MLLNKPVGVLSSVGDPQGRPTVTDEIPDRQRLFPVGRLDMNSRGLLLLTDDGDLAMRLMHPSHGVEKEYRVVIAGNPAEAALKRLATGMVVGGEKYQPVEVRLIAAGEERSTLSMVLREGRNREVRRLWRALGHRVMDLQRVRIDGLHLGDLPEGAMRPLSGEELAGLKAAVF
jgi:23S rRNA pseudouridine2605 synthase